MDRYKRFIVFLLLLLFLSTFVAVSHHHESADDDRDCQICIAIKQQYAAGPSAAAFDGTPFITETTLITSAPAIIDTPSFLSCSNRGPPA
jgi:hypothetical protein